MASYGENVLSYHDTLLRQTDVGTLEPGKWVNDNIISFWFEYLEHEVYSDYEPFIKFIPPDVAQFIKSAAEIPSQVSDVSSVLESMNLSKKQLILIPINDSPTDAITTSGTHWTLATFTTENGTFEHYDSFAGSVNHLHAQAIFHVLSPILIPDRASDIELDFCEVACTQQRNNSDCGIHLICNADAVCKKYFLGDERPVSEIVSIDVINKTRNELKTLISKIRQRR
ncbi:sentrin-specific protease 8 [Tetranychus urticae]|uniref:Ubiquitin-like protease family profile domain-containing protein n=1 Tax=Tetranychus urticae TaxID=32264 RepID=T1L470_TETUR|nr:sentrin-specific protease 8 [Tetranychus urticae]